jgi:hypothetical protein
MWEWGRSVASKLEILFSEIRVASSGNAVHSALLLSYVNEKIAVEAASIQANNSPTELNAYGAGAQVYKDPFSHRGK